jgi:hypothetical protein
MRWRLLKPAEQWLMLSLSRNAVKLMQRATGRILSTRYQRMVMRWSLDHLGKQPQGRK